MLQLTVIGHLGADAEVKDYNGKKFVSFRVAHSERYTSSSGESKERTQWVSCALNGDGGSLLQYLKRGQLVAVMGDCTLGLANSQIMRSMVPTCNVHVTNIELLGGSPSGDLPKQLADSNGQLVDTLKFWSVSQEDFQRINPNAQDVNLYDNKGGRYVLTGQGLIMPDNSSAPTETDQGTEGTTATNAQQKTKRKSKKS